MKYTREERLDIGRRIYAGELSRYQAAEEYGISVNMTAMMNINLMYFIMTVFVCLFVAEDFRSGFLTVTSFTAVISPLLCCVNSSWVVK